MSRKCARRGTPRERPRLGFALLRKFPHNLNPTAPFLFVSRNSSESESMRTPTMANSAADESMEVVREAENEHLYEPFQEVPPHVYDQIIEACRPFYALRELDEAPSLPDSTGLQTNHLQLPLRFEDSVAQQQRRPKATTAKRRIVSPSPEVRQCTTVSRWKL